MVVLVDAPLSTLEHTAYGRRKSGLVMAAKGFVIVRLEWTLEALGVDVTFRGSGGVAAQRQVQRVGDLRKQARITRCWKVGSCYAKHLEIARQSLSFLVLPVPTASLRPEAKEPG